MEKETPIRGGSYLRQPDGSLVEAQETVNEPVEQTADQPFEKYVED